MCRRKCFRRFCRRQKKSFGFAVWKFFIMNARGRLASWYFSHLTRTIRNFIVDITMEYFRNSTSNKYVRTQIAERFSIDIKYTSTVFSSESQKRKRDHRGNPKVFLQNLNVPVHSYTNIYVYAHIIVHTRYIIRLW